MKASPGLDLDRAVQARSVQIFIKRVSVTFAALLLLGGCIIYFLIYLPLNRALQSSLTDNFSQVFSVSYQSFQSKVQRGLEGARSLSSRTMIKAAIQEYKSGAISMDELTDYCQSKYEDGARALEHLVLTERFVDGTAISRYAPSPDHVIDLDAALTPGTEADLRITVRDGRVYSVILSPVTDGGRVLGYDRLVFDLTEDLTALGTDRIETRLLDDAAWETLIRDSETIRDDGEVVLKSAGDCLIARACVQEHFYFISKQDRSSLFEPIHRLGIKVFVVGVCTLSGFIIAVYLYVVRYAKRELVDLEISHSALEKVASEVNVDALTRAGSRRFGTESLMRAFTEFKAGGASPLILMFDIDCFKDINDRLGHDTGDLVLKEVVAAVYRAIRSEDQLFRWGGDEFAGIFYGVKEEGVQRFADKILQAVFSSKIDAGGEIVSPTVSMGISAFKESDTAFSDALKRADQAMYQSKAEGRNRVNLL